MDVLTNTGSQRLGDALKRAIDDDAKLSIIASCFTVFAYQGLQEELSKIDELRFIFDKPTFIKSMQDEKQPREFQVSQVQRERAVGGTGLELTLRNNLNQRALARECAEWARERVRFKSAQRAGTVNMQSLYYVENARRPDESFAGLGSTPFTLEGLGYEETQGTVTSVVHSVGTEAAGLKAQFDAIWGDDAMVEDVTEKVLEQIGTLYRENPPELVYFLALYHVFRDYLEDSADDPMTKGVKFEESVIWNKLYDFQKDAVLGAIRKLGKYKGCIIADSVGLGKTFEALAVIKYYQERNDRVLVLAPKRLRENWTLYTRNNDDRNPLADDRFNYDVLNHTDLSRYHGMSGDIDLEHIRWENYDLLVIDESHNFRNQSTDEERKDRYTRLIEDVIKRGVRTKVLMLSATPVNNRLLDVRNQIRLITEDDEEYLLETDDIRSVTDLLRKVQGTYGQWNKLPDGERTVERFLSMTDPAYFRLLDALTIARSRKHIEKYYGAQDGIFPKRRQPISFQTGVDRAHEMPAIGDLNDRISRLSFAQYQLLAFVRPGQKQAYEDRYGDRFGKDFQSQVNRSSAVANLMRVNMLKRLESSVNSFGITLQRVLDSAETLRKRLEHAEGTYHYSTVNVGEYFDDEEDAREFEVGGGVTVDLRDVDTVRLAEALDYDIEELRDMLKATEQVTPERDEKLQQLKEFLAEKAKAPYNEGNKKILVFSAFADTTRYLFDQLAPWLKGELGLEAAEVNGDRNRTYSLKLPRASFENILARFSPVSKELPANDRAAGEIDVLFATDCISEGQNLQDCDCLVNYDIHWNPVRIVQRFGRIDRLGSTNDQIQLVNFWPDMELDEYINLEDRVKGRMTLMDVSATGEENLLAPKQDKMNDMAYRKKQLEQLKSEGLDLEDIAGGISITDFAFDDFREELRRFDRKNPGVLEAAPIGLHAVAEVPEELRDEFGRGVVFCLEQNPRVEDPRDGNPTFPYYLVYVSKDGRTITKHTQPKPALDLMRAACTGRTAPTAALCRAFNRETKDGTRMSAYTELLDEAVASITGESREKGLDSLFSFGEVGTGTVAAFDDFSLVCMLVLR